MKREGGASSAYLRKQIYIYVRQSSVPSRGLERREAGAGSGSSRQGRPRAPCSDRAQTQTQGLPIASPAPGARRPLLLLLLLLAARGERGAAGGTEGLLALRAGGGRRAEAGGPPPPPPAAGPGAAAHAGGWHLRERAAVNGRLPPATTERQRPPVRRRGPGPARAPGGPRGSPRHGNRDAAPPTAASPPEGGAGPAARLTARLPRRVRGSAWQGTAGAAGGVW